MPWTLERSKPSALAANMLVPALQAYVATEPSQRSPDDDAAVRQLRVAAGAIATALIEVSRMSPPPQPAIQPRSPNVGAPS